MALGRKLAEAIAAALPARRMEAIAAAPLGQRSRRAKAEPDAEPRASTPKPAGKSMMAECTRSVKIYPGSCQIIPVWQGSRLSPIYNSGPAVPGLQGTIDTGGSFKRANTIEQSVVAAMQQAVPALQTAGSYAYLGTVQMPPSLWRSFVNASPSSDSVS